MKRVILIISVITMLFSCKNSGSDLQNGNQNGGNSENIIGEKFICSGHQINRYYKMSNISIREDALKKDDNGNYVMTVDFVTNDFYGYRWPEEEIANFKKCVEKFGDTASKMRFPEPIDVGFAISAFIKQIEISSSEVFDANHSSNSSLADIVRIEYLTAFPSIKANYNPEGLEGLIEPTVDYAELLYGVQRINKLIDKVSPDEMAMIYLNSKENIIYCKSPEHKNILYRLFFTEAPADAVRTITIKIVTDEGVYSTTKKVAFL